jgi:hypothetical protein
MEETIVGTYGNQAEAEMWAEVLRGAGISCRVTRVSVEVAAVGFDAWVPHELRCSPELRLAKTYRRKTCRTALAYPRPAMRAVARRVIVSDRIC